jgi:hypothetical protein
MRGYTFECQKEKDRDSIFNGLFNIVKDSNDFKLKDIVITKWEMPGLWYVGIIIADSVAGSFSIITMNAFNKSMKSVFTIVKADCQNTEVLIPDSVKISMLWKEDSVNRYKIYYENFSFIKSLLLEGATPEKLKEIYGIDFTAEECEKIKTKDKP